ncbi:hypothetical protein ACP6H9_22155 [Vibrio harveyi]|uniref:hypothetical protein n=1 Tax=Vibrio harveyi TaxID=669 RepID=UPI00215C47DB|nr:hypothetical protein [Vibrio harveyi]MCR9772576.1 hypothetical protein [Vibrio harveyi]
MDWETVNGITGLISAICSVFGISYFGTRSNHAAVENHRVLSFPRLMAFLVCSAGWTILCLCGLWLFEPFGSFVSDKEYLKFYAIVIAFPALAVFLFGIELLIWNRIA